MRKVFLPQTVIPGVRRRVDPDTLMTMGDEDGKPLWDMPAPTSHAKHKSGNDGIPIMVPVYRGTSASYARWVKAQIRRRQRKAAEAQAEVDALNEAENVAQEAEKAMQDLVLNPGGYDDCGKDKL